MHFHTWGLTVATYNRRETLLKTIEYGHVAGARPKGQGRTSPFGRYGWHVNGAYLSRRLYGGGPLVRINALANWSRFLLFDFVVALRRRDFGKVRGAMLAFPTIVRLMLCRQAKIGEVLRRDSTRVKKKLYEEDKRR